MKKKRKIVTCYCDKRYMDMVKIYSPPSAFWIKAYKPQGLILQKEKDFCKITMENL